jgi:hypothetical protein
MAWRGASCHAPFAQTLRIKLSHRKVRFGSKRPPTTRKEVTPLRIAEGSIRADTVRQV